MQSVKAIVLGLVQGFTEFLPVSSSGHLILLEQAGLTEPSVFLNVMLHLGTLLSVFFVFYKQIFYMLRHPIKSDLRYILIASIPTGIIAILFKTFLEEYLTGKFLPLFFMVSAVVLILSSYFSINKNRTLTLKNALLTGVMQGIAVLPGISRSGVTVSTLTMLGVDKKKAMDFSFMLSIPIILASVVLELTTLDKPSVGVIEPIPLMVGMAFSFLGGVISLTLLYKAIKKSSFLWFGIYLAVLSLVTLFFYF